jgi:hypothetical protein
MSIKKHNSHASISKFKRIQDDRYDNLTWEDIPFEELYVTDSQWNSFDIAHVKDILDHFHPALLRASSVALIDGKYVLWEGQHSATVAYLAGMDKIHCGVYKCDDMKFKDISSIEKFSQPQLAELIYMFMEDTGIQTIDEVIKYIKIPDYIAE